MTRMILSVLILAALPAAAGAVLPETPAGALARRVAGPPTDCIGLIERDRESQLFRDGSILYGGRGSTLWLNRPASCPAFLSNRAIVSVTPIGSLCRGDIIQVTDPASGVSFGSCALGEFVPYRRAN